MTKRIRVALVEDNGGIRESLERLFSTTDDITLAGVFKDGESAVAGMEASAPDVALVDINLPGISGIDVIRQMKARLPHVQFMVLTVYDDPTRIFQALAAGATGYLLKHEDPAELISAVHDLHRGGSPMSGSVARRVVLSFHQMGDSTDAQENLTPREAEILQLLAKGYLYKEIAENLSIGNETVRTHVRHIYDKLHVRTRTEAVIKHLKGNR